MNNIINKLYSIGIVPVVKIDDPNTAVPIAKALLNGGIPCVEITFRTEYAKQAMIDIKRECPEVLIGAGTITSKTQVDEALAAGATFMVSAGLNPEIVQYCNDKDVPIFPGCSNASDIEMAISLGLTNVKFFPSEAVGGLKLIKSLAGPYTNIKFMPTGGITDKNINEYLAFDKIIACGGSYMIPDEAIKTGNYEEITKISRRTIKKILGLEVAHVGINAQNENECMDICDMVSNITLSEKNIGNSSVFVGDFEVMKAPFKGEKGHIALGTLSVDRAKAYFEANGYEFDESTAKYVSGKLISIYFKQEIAGFAYHLVLKK